MKIVVICAFIVGLALIEGSFAQSHNFEWGQRENGDRELFRKIVIKKKTFLQVVTKDVSYIGNDRISYIKCTDQYTNGNGGYASLLKGGNGYNNATLHLKSQRNHGFNFVVEIYGREL